MFQPGFLVHPTLGIFSLGMKVLVNFGRDANGNTGVAYPDGEPMHGAGHEEEHTLDPMPTSI